jgi:hypothetical protein
MAVLHHQMPGPEPTSTPLVIIRGRQPPSLARGSGRGPLQHLASRDANTAEGTKIGNYPLLNYDIVTCDEGDANKVGIVYGVLAVVCGATSSSPPEALDSFFDPPRLHIRCGRLPINWIQFKWTSD